MNYKSYSVGVSYLSFYLFQNEVVTCINKPPELFLVKLHWAQCLLGVLPNLTVLPSMDSVAVKMIKSTA